VSGTEAVLSADENDAATIDLTGGIGSRFYFNVMF
jgi:hypothetical protein